jgi:hypothetical protein
VAVPALSSGDIVAIDNLASHKSPEIRKAAEVARQIRTAAKGSFCLTAAMIAADQERR